MIFTALLNLAIEAAKAAGKEIMTVYEDGNFSVDFKADDSPLTKADKAAHTIIKKFLEASGLPILSEEGVHIPFSERKDWKNYWLVDPLDGTKEFIKRNGEFTVNIALIKGNEPVVGVVYAACLDQLYYGAKGEGAYKYQGGSETALPIGKNQTVKDLSSQECVTVVASRSHSNAETEEFISQFKNTVLSSMGSSLKFMLLAEEKADVYPRLAPTMEWDTAAAHAILNALNRGVYRTDFSGELEYNKESLVNSYFISL